MNGKEIEAIAQAMNVAGIRLTARYEPIGCDFCLKPSDISDFLSDRFAFFARECGLSREEYLEWRKFIRSGAPCLHSGRGISCGKTIAGASSCTPQEYFIKKRKGLLLCSSHLRKMRKEGSQPPS
jgi:hypothetical protein